MYSLKKPKKPEVLILCYLEKAGDCQEIEWNFIGNRGCFS